MPDLSIIIVTYNPGDDIDDCLNSIFENSSDLTIEVIVVDNDSHDGTPERIQRSFPEVHFIGNPTNDGFSVANNIGLKVAAGRYILLLNPDVILRPTTLRQMIDYLDAESGVGIVGPRVYTGTGAILLTANDTYTPAGTLWQFFGIPYRILRRTCLTAIAPVDVAWVQGACLMLRREIYEQIGGLDEGLFLFCEEPDFCERALHAGWRTVYLPQAEITHYVSSTVTRYPLVKMRHHHISPLYYFRKRGRSTSVRILKIGFITELGMKWFLRAAQNVVKPNEFLQAKMQAYPIVIKEIWRY
ncbi:MAG: glycosyltransferase family 2 protein [Anaerolineae bacterium]